MNAIGCLLSLRLRHFLFNFYFVLWFSVKVGNKQTIILHGTTHVLIVKQMNDNKRGKSSEGDGYAYRGRGRGGNQGSGSGTARGGKGNGGIGTGVGRMRVLPPNNIGNLTGQLPGLMAVETHGGGRGNGNQRGSGLPNRGNRGWRRHNSDHSKASSAPAPQVVENLNANQAEQSDDNDEPVPVPAMPKRHKKERFDLIQLLF